MRNIRLDIAYDGTDFAGWQIQKNANSIESELRNAIKQNNIELFKLTGSGRTDAGVHANSQTANILIDSTIPGDRVKFALNNKLPDSIRVLNSEEVDLNFSARYSALAKHYSYHVDLSEVANPINRKYSWSFPYNIDREKLDYVTRFLSGRHDYMNFMSTGSKVKTTDREIYFIKPVFTENELVLNYFGNGFLYNMVRILTGTILEYSIGKIEKQRLDNVFKIKNRKLAGITAPAKGLFLERVFYNFNEIEEFWQSFLDIPKSSLLK